MKTTTTKKIKTHYSSNMGTIQSLSAIADSFQGDLHFKQYPKEPTRIIEVINRKTIRV